MLENINEILDGLRDKAQDIYRNNYELKRLVDKSLSFLRENPELNRFKKDISLLLSLAKDYVDGQYRDISQEAMLLIIGSLIYIVSPIDLIPDSIFGGFVDDILLVALVLKRLRPELDKYEAWKKNKNEEIYMLDDKKGW